MLGHKTLKEIRLWHFHQQMKILNFCVSLLEPRDCRWTFMYCNTQNAVYFRDLRTLYLQYRILYADLKVGSFLFYAIFNDAILNTTFFEVRLNFPALDKLGRSWVTLSIVGLNDFDQAQNFRKPYFWRHTFFALKSLNFFL